MIAVDSNLLIYAHRVDSPWHTSAFELVRSLAEGRPAWAIPWPCLHEFLAVATHPRIYQPPSPVEQTLRQVDAWLGSPSLVLLGEGPVYWPRLRQAISVAKATGGRVHDARIAALCLEHRVSELWSADRDLGRFAGLKVRNPLMA
ncbi:MAG: type II toxin-antitoxin system VapC family toxin [Acidimicrobiia bacterium]